jgi:hypothetical protein
MTQADRVLSTPPTNTSALPIDPTRRRFLTVAAVGSVAGASTLAAAAFTPNDVPKAVTIPAPRSELFAAWERSHPQPKSKKGKRRWIKQMAAYHSEVTPASWHALMAAEQAFANAQIAVAAIPIASVADLHAMAACSTIYDAVELCRHNRAPIARVVAQEYFRLGKAVQS